MATMTQGNAQRKLNRAASKVEKYRARKAEISERMAARAPRRNFTAKPKGAGKIARLDRRIGRANETIAKAHATLRPI